MKASNYNKTGEATSKKCKKRKVFIFFTFGAITLFLLSFSVTTFILMNSFRLTFAGDNLAQMQQEISLLKNEIAHKDSEIEELKLQLANIEGESSFVNQFQIPALELRE